MDFLEVLTIILITLKLVGICDYSWWVAWSPFIVYFIVVFLNRLLENKEN